jgi:teichuronopeptide biosynthesis TupA-like protein
MVVRISVPPLALPIVEKVLGLDQSLLECHIHLKWLNDKRRLPLTPEHWQLYDIIHRFYWRHFGRFPNLVNCRDLNEKIQWLKLFDQSEDVVRCTDKILVRDYVRERVGEHYLVELFQVHRHFCEIDFDSLPDGFVIKTNNDCGTVILVRNKSEFDHQTAAKRVEAALRCTYGWEGGEWQYSYIKPMVLVEELIEPQSQKPPPDYKFYCIHGVVRFCHYIYDRGSDIKEQIIDAEGNDLATGLAENFKRGTDFRKPALWGEMIRVAQELGRGFKCVRVDLYCTGDRIYVGEMTFTPGSGIYNGKGQERMGKYLDFDRSTYKPPLHSK